MNFLTKALSSKRSKKVWKVIRPVLNHSPRTTRADPEQSNQYFIKTTERTMVTTPDGNAELWELIDSFHEPDGRPFTLSIVTDGEVFKELFQLRSDCSTGVDQIPVKYVKLVRDQFIGPVTHIINVCVSTSHFPRI